MEDFFRKYWWAIVLVVLGVPLVIGLLMEYGVFATFGGGDSDGWLGFWGGYLGTVISLPVSVWISIQTIHEENQRNKNNISESKNNELEIEQIKRENQKFDNILECSTRYQVEILKLVHWSSEDLVWASTLRELNEIIIDLLGDKHDKFLTEFNVNRSRLSKERRQVFQEKIDCFGSMISQILDEQAELTVQLQDNHHMSDKNSPEMKAFVKVKRDFKVVQDILGDIADICLEQIKYE